MQGVVLCIKGGQCKEIVVCIMGGEGSAGRLYYV